MHLQEALIAEIVEEHAGVEAERREAVIRAENAESELADAHRAARIVAIGAHTFATTHGFTWFIHNAVNTTPFAVGKQKANV